MEWVSLMISKTSFSGNIKIQTRIKIGPETQGVGILLGISDPSERRNFHDGYCIWFGKQSSLFHNNIEVMTIAEHPLDDNTDHFICIEKVDNHLFIYIDNKKTCHYISHIPLSGTHLGILCRDADFQIDPIQVMSGSQNVMVNCLAVPDAFLANKNYAKALLEYRRITSSFAGRTEGREAIFRAGITLLEKAASHRKKREKERLHLLALDEFGKLRATPAAPLEYLGKSLVYKATGEIEEEIKCLELCIRKYSKHPMLHLIREHVAFRLHETSSRLKAAAYHFALLALRHLPQIFQSQDHASLLLSLKKHLEKLPFFLLAVADEEYLACQLAFWLNKPITLVEMIETSTSPAIIANAMYGLLAMGHKAWVEENLHYLKGGEEEKLIEIALLYFKGGPQTALSKLVLQIPASPSNIEMRCAQFLFTRSLLEGKSKEALPYFQAFPNTPTLDAMHICASLLQKESKKALEILEAYPPEILSDEYSPLFLPMGYYLLQAEGKDIALSHFSGSIDLPYPPTTMLLSYYLRGKIEGKKGWLSHAFVWEKIAFFYQLSLYYHFTKNYKKEQEYARRLKQQLKHLATS